MAVLEQVELDGTGSTDPDGDQLTYEWFLNGAELAEGPTVPFGFVDPGTYTLTLVVSDGSWSSVDMTSVEVVEGGPAADPVVAIDVEPADGSAGWYRHAPVAATVSVTASNPVTGVECTGGAVGAVSVDGTTATAEVAATGGALTCTATDATGATGSATTTVLVDATAPVVTGTVSPQPVVLGGPVSASASATDGGSGLAGAATCGSASSATVGMRTITCTATDVAGNVGTATVQYRVGYGFQGFEQPVDLGVVNVANAGRAIPLKWRLVDAAGVPVTGLRAVSVTSVVTSCAGGSTPTDAVEEYATGSSGLQDLGDGRYQFNWNTPRSYAGQCRTVLVDAGDGIVHTAQFRFR